MAYTQQTWVDWPAGNTPLSAARMTHIEAGVAAAATTADAAAPTTYVDAADSTTLTKATGVAAALAIVFGG